MQEPFARARPWVVASCALGLGAGFLLAAVLSVTQAVGAPLGIWWLAIVQAHGHVQIFGWAGLLVVGVALHFLPRLRGAPLAYPRAIPWLLALLGSGLGLQAFAQPLLALGGTGAHLWQVVLASAGLAQCAGASGVVALLSLTLRRGPSLARRPALLAFLPYALIGLWSFWLALALNAVEGVRLLLVEQAMFSGQMDATITQLGLYGFLVPFALGMAARVLPLYVGLRPLPAKGLWVVFSEYVAGLLLGLLGLWMGGSIALIGYFQGGAALLMGSAMLAFILWQGALLPQRWTRLIIPAIQTRHGSLPARPYPVAQGNDRAAFGPYAWLIRCAFGWLALAALIFCLNGGTLLAGASFLIDDDATRHATTVGFVMLLAFGVGQRMLPGFAGRKLLSRHLVTATLWLGNVAALLRVAPVLGSAWFARSDLPGWVAPLLQGAFGASGPLALLAVLCFTMNLWRILRAASGIKTAAAANASADAGQR
jgi:uncharacterized protein involved in response to NO